MLVCNVSLRPPRLAIAADIVEAGLADDASTSGNVVFATLVDDPASVHDTVDAHLGEIMLEAASASATVDAARAYNAAIIEAAAAASLQDSIVPVATNATFNGTASNTTLSSGNLIATADSSGLTGGARSNAQKTAGKYYFELTIGPWVSAQQSAMGVITSAGTYANMYNDGSNSTEVLTNGGTIFSNNTTGGQNIGMPVAGDVISVAIDLDNRTGWLRRNGGSWNGSGTANPATNTGGVPIQATVSFAPAVAFGTSHGVGDKYIGNFGDSAFVYSRPSGFSNWPSS